jgi:microcystin-dependent protein
MNPLLASILLFAGNFAPIGWAFCDGSILSISQNTALFSLLGTTYGGNGTSNFALPDMRGRVPIGMGNGPGLSPVILGETGGVENITLTINQMPQHSHTLNGHTALGDTSDPTNAIPANTGALDREYKGNTAPNTVMNPAAIGASGGSQPVAIRNPYLGMNYIIALQGIFPSRN